MSRIYFITGTDTGVGKTVLTALLVRRLRQLGVGAMAVKPFCSGGRADARLLREAQEGALGLDEINPWHFRAPVAPLLAARRERRRVTRKEAVTFLRSSARRCETLLIEGAGGLLSPLGEGFDARDLIRELDALPVVVSPDRLGAVNQVRLVLSALPARLAGRACVVLMQSARRAGLHLGNRELLSAHVPSRRLLQLPRVRLPAVLRSRSAAGGFTRMLDGLAGL